MNLVLGLLYLYIAVYSVFFFIKAVRNLGNRKFLRQKRNARNSVQNKLCVILYAHDNDEGLAKMVQQLKEQTYNPDNYIICLILDNCTGNSEKIFGHDNALQIFSIKDQGAPIGKDQALSIFLEQLKLSERKICDAYVFLDVDRFIKRDFLSTINAALIDSAAVTGATILLGENLNLRQKIKKAYHKYYVNFIQRSRAMMNLAAVVDSDIFVIRHEILAKIDQIGHIKFTNINSELEYSLLLSRLNSKCSFNPNIKTYVNVDDVKLRIPNLSARLDLFKDNIGQTLVGANFAYIEQVYSLLNPNIILLLIAYEFLLEYSFGYYFVVDFSVILISFCILVLGFALSLINSKLKGLEYFYLFMYPFYSITHIFKNFPVCRFVRNKLTGSTEGQNIEKFVVNVEVTNGKKSLPYVMELISENGFAKVKLISMHSGKKLTTKTNFRMIDAISEISTGMVDKGLTLKICQCCSHFNPNIDGSNNMINGFCSLNAGQLVPTLLWNSCSGFCKCQQQSLMEELSNND